MGNTVEVSHVSKSFNGQPVVRDISFEIAPGEVFGLIGPNGAGKTTIIRMLLDIIRPDSGEVKILNGQSGEAKDSVGYLPEERGLYRRLSVMDTLAYLGALKNSRSKRRALELLEKMATAIIDGSLCALGSSAPNPVLSTIRYFRDEYEAHIKEKRCPAGVCKALILYSIDPEKCTGCTVCAKVCPTGAAKGVRKEAHTIDAAVCTKCGACRESCKFDAIIVR